MGALPATRTHQVAARLTFQNRVHFINQEAPVAVVTRPTLTDLDRFVPGGVASAQHFLVPLL